jgi:diguanylate cyclase (GGDEF)-like protein
MMFGNTAIRLLDTLINKLRFLRQNYAQVIFWPIAACALSIAGWTALHAKLDEDKRDIENTSLREAGALSKGYADHLARTLEAVDQIILHVRYEWELTQGHLQLENAVQRGLFSAGSVLLVSIVDRNGFIVTSTYADLRDPAHKRSLTDRAYFRAQRDAEKDFLYIDEPLLGPVSGQNRIRFTRRLPDRNGQFDGIVMVNVAAAYFTANYDNTTLGEHGLLGVVGRDGIIRATRVGQRVHMPTSQALVALPDFRSPYGSILLTGNEWFADKRSRYVGWQAIPGYPMIALVGLDQQDTLAPYWDKYTSSVRYATGATLALALFALIGMALSLRLAWRKHQIEVIQATYRKATEEGSEGFYIFRPLRMRDGAIRDFEVIDCNHRGAELFRLHCGDLIGKSMSSLYSGTGFEDLMKRLQQAMDLGFYESDIEIPNGWPVSACWVHLKIARSEDDLALTMLDISDRKAHVDELERRGNEDPVTGLPNRHWLQAYLASAVESAAAARSMLALLFVDLDGFKLVNDALGHVAGDEVLRITAKRLRLAVRPQDHLARWGSDEFVVVLENIADRRDAARVAEQVLRAFEDSFQLTQGERSLNASVGISIFPDDGTDAGTLLRNADIAMYSVKRTGKGSYRFFDPVFYERLRIRIEKELELREAIDKDQFTVYYQPRVDMSTGAVCSMEALIRWMHPTKGLIGPIEFVPLAEETGLILALGEFVVEKVCAHLASWERQHLDLVPVSVNVSARQFDETDVTAIFSSSLKRYHVDPALIEIEVTESSMMTENTEVSAVLGRLHGIGVKLCIDDFGTGYSSLSQLQRLDFDVLKIDRTFTTEIEKTEAGKVFVTAIITMAHALGMRVVAEGVENERQVAILLSLQCDEIQGFYIAPPLPPLEAHATLCRRFFSPAAA